MTSARRLTCFWDLAETRPALFSIAWYPVFLLSLAWAFLSRVKRALAPAPYQSPIPSLCVGNLTLGGSGKTPVVKALADHFKALNPVLISRGYRGAAEKQGARVSLEEARGAIEYGDEPWMLAHQTGLPTYVGKNRRRSVQLAEKERPGLLLFDDGFQNTQVRYSQSILLWDPHLGSRGQYCFPLGLLREPLSGRQRASQVVLASKSGMAERGGFTCAFETEGPFDEKGQPASGLETLPLGAFCGIGNEAPFFTDLKRRYRLVHEASFGDHYWYTPHDVERLNRLAEAKGLAGWILTEKDWFRLGEARARFNRPLYFTRLTAKLTPELYEALASLRAQT